MKDNGRIIMQDLQGILYCEAYMDDEFSLDDLRAIIDEIRTHYQSHSDVILKKVGRYSVSLQAQLKLGKTVKEFRNFVYVVDNDVKRNSAQYAAGSYMRAYNTQIAHTQKEALALLKSLSRQR